MTKETLWYNSPRTYLQKKKIDFVSSLERTRKDGNIYTFAETILNGVTKSLNLCFPKISMERAISSCNCFLDLVLRSICTN